MPLERMDHDGWSGATFARLARDGRRFVLKRDRWASDWICRATDDVWLREGVLAACPPRFPDGVDAPFLGAAWVDDGYALLMPDLGGRLLDWSQPIETPTLDTVLAGVARLHAGWLSTLDDDRPSPPFPWCPLDARLRLLGPAAAARYVRDGNAAGSRFQAGWAAFRRRASPRAVELIDALDAQPSPLLEALAGLPSRSLHGDLKLANVGIGHDGGVLLIDWQLTLRAPVAVELAWFLVANVANLPLDPDGMLDRYVARLAGDATAVLGDGDLQRELVWPIGLWLRGWRKAIDADAGLRFPSGTTAVEDLALWCARAERAAEALGV